MFIKKSILLFVAAVVAVFFAYPQPTQADFKKDFLYKFQSRWSDIAVNTAGTRIFIINESYSRIEEYSAAGALLAIHGNFGTGNTEFNRPQGLAIDATDVLYVLDTGNNRVVRYSALSATPGDPLSFNATWGSYGITDEGTFNNPTGIATDGTSVYIADTDNNRVQKCTGAGPASTCEIWGSLGTSDGKFSSPKGITYDASSTNVYVTDTGNNRVQVFNTSGVYQSKFGTYGSGTSQFTLPYRIATESTNSFVYVLDTLNRVQRLSKATGITDSTITLGSSGGGITVLGSATLYIASLPTTFQTYNPLTMAAILAPINETDVGRPVDMAIDTSGNFFINNNFNQFVSLKPVIQKFNSLFVQTGEWTGNGDFGITASGPMGIGINTSNDLLVADTDKNQIQKFTSSGTWVYTLTPAPTPGVFSNPKDVATEATGKYYVADTGNSRIMKFEPDGTFVWSQVLPTVAAGTPTPPLGATPAPYGMTVASDNKIYVADVGYHRILRYTANDNGFDGSWGEYGSADSSPIPQLDTPQGMAIDSAGNIYVADTGNNRIQRFDQLGTLATRVLWGSYGTQDGNFDQPRNVVVDSNNHVFVSEVGNRRIQAFGDATNSAGLVVTQTNGTTVSEGATAATTVIDNYTVKLSTQPSATVFIAITVSDPTQATVTTPTLAFTPYNWNIPQTVTVVPTHDFIANGTRSVVISHKPSSTDDHYKNPSNVTWSDVTATINDTVDVAGITFESGYNAAGTGTWMPYPDSNTVPWATEGATLSNAYSITLDTKPTANVVVTLSPATALTLDETVLTFTSVNWNTPQFVHITPVHDSVAQATHSATINHTAASTDPNYASPTVTFSGASGNVIVTIQDIDAAGVTVSPLTLSLNETGTGSTATYTVTLNSKPTGTVTIYPTDASTSAHVTLSPSTLTFLTTTWNTAQTVTVTAVHDYLQNTPDFSPSITKILHDGTVSLDPLYSNTNIASIAATIVNTDTSELLISKPGGGSVQVTEGGATDNYIFQLTNIPTDTVTVTLTSDAQVTTAASSYTFTPSNWNVPQYATVSAVDDYVEEGTHYGLITHTLSSLDSNFEGKIATQTATITDNDTAGITIRLPNGAINIAEGGPTDTYFVRLNSEPSSTVLLDFGAQNQATASPGVLTFNAGNWSNEQEITITANRDYIYEGQHTATITYTGVSADTKYNGETASFVANISDDDNYLPGVFVTESGGSTSVTKDITTDTYTLELTSKPTANVKVKITANGPEATTSASVYWFTPSTWNVKQTVTVTALTSPSGGKTVKFSHLITSSDSHYNGITAPTVTVTVNENQSSSPSAANAKAPTCGTTPPYSAPNLFQITTNQTQATLYFTPLRENISYYFVAFGFTPGDLRFGTSFEMGPYDGVIDYTVNMLTPGTKYYFMIRGGNGCATGPWSGSLAATAVGPESSAQTTWTFYASATTSSTSGSSGTSGGSSGGSSPTGGIWLTRDLYPGSQGADVRSLQEHLNAHGFTLTSSGAGSPGNETTYYGNLTAAAVRRFQEAHFAEILSPLGYASGTGICGPATRNYINSHP